MAEKQETLAWYEVLAMGLYHAALAVLLAYALYNVWPPQPWPGDQPTKVTASANATPTPTPGAAPAAPSSAPSAAAGGPQDNPYSPYPDERPPRFTLFGKSFQPTLEVRLLFVVMLAAALGSFVHSATSFVSYVGNKKLGRSWVWWYLLRPFIGLTLALIFYFVFRGGFITAGVNNAGDAAASFINPFGVAALAGLVGMFSKVAADKLDEVFTTLFRPAPGEGDAKRGDKLESSAPTVTAINPPAYTLSSPQDAVVTGVNFVETSEIHLDGKVYKDVYTNSSTLTFRPEQATRTGDLTLLVINPPPGGGRSNTLIWTVNA
ncbi:MAG TPA: hypothetical protein VKB12_10420 [Pyrinomonadaceae bacterium]|nr:hypothetical protein [Pyrinomonadaceae bacterium]